MMNWLYKEYSIIVKAINCFSLLMISDSILFVNPDMKKKIKMVYLSATHKKKGVGQYNREESSRRQA